MSVFALSPLNSYQMQFRWFKGDFNTGHYHYQSDLLIAEHSSVYFAHFIIFIHGAFTFFFLAPQNLVLFLNHSTTIRLGLWDFDWCTVVTLSSHSSLIPVSICFYFIIFFRIFNAFINHFGVIQPWSCFPHSSLGLHSILWYNTKEILLCVASFWFLYESVCILHIYVT